VSAEVVAHLERQTASARRLLGIVLAQGESIRDQDVEGVLARLADMQTELVARHQLEAERDSILATAAARLGRNPDAIDLELLVIGAPAAEGERARELSAELRGLLVEVGRVHEANRVLLRQELVFLGHLMRVLSGAPQAGYSPTGFTTVSQPGRAVDARA
jgi:hypothetical protein